MIFEKIAFLLAGLLLFAMLAALVKKLEHDLLAPSFFFFAAFSAHAYLDPAVRIGESVHFNIESFHTLFAFTALATSFLAIGYIYSFHGVKRIKLQRDPRRVPIFTVFSKNEYIITCALVVLMSLALFIGLYQVGRWGLAKGAFVDDHTSTYSNVRQLSYAFYSFVPALFLSAQKDALSRDKLFKALTFLMLFIVAVYSLLEFGRRAIFTTLLVILIIYHNRVRVISRKAAISAATLIILVTAASLFRRAGTGILSLSSTDIVDLSDSGALAVGEVANQLLTTIPGQSVFSNVISFIEQGEPLRYGMTYLESLLTLLMPFSNYLDIRETLPYWYKSIYAPYLKDFGFGFSMLAESFLNFYWGGVIVFFVIGLAVGKLSRVIRFSQHSVRILWSSIIIASLVSGLRDDSYATFAKMVYFILPFAFWYYVIIGGLRNIRSPQVRLFSTGPPASRYAKGIVTRNSRVTERK